MTLALGLWPLDRPLYLHSWGLSALLDCTFTGEGLAGGPGGAREEGDEGDEGGGGGLLTPIIKN